jgi:hypothetical protein
MEDGILLKLRKAKNGRIYKQVMVPKLLKEDIWRLCHDNYTGAHFGDKKTWAKLYNRFYWKNCYKETMEYVRSCEICARLKNPPATRSDLQPITDYNKPFDKVAVDILELTRTNNGNKYVVVFTDYLTRWVEAFPLRNTTAETIAKVFINEIVTRHSAPSELLSDCGTNFLSKLVKEVCDYFKINKINTSPYNPRCDGLVERFNKTLCKMLAAYSDSNQSTWDLYLPLVLMAYRTSEQSTTKESPFRLLYGREPRLMSDYDVNKYSSSSPFLQDLHSGWVEAKRQLMKQAETSKAIYDSKYVFSPPVYKVGDWVRVKRPQTRIGLKTKLRKDLWSEPFQITRVLSNKNIEVQWTPKQKKALSVDNVKPKEPDRISETINDTVLSNDKHNLNKFRPTDSFKSPDNSARKTADLTTQLPNLSSPKTSYKTKYGRVIKPRKF